MQEFQEFSNWRISKQLINPTIGGGSPPPLDATNLSCTNRSYLVATLLAKQKYFRTHPTGPSGTWQSFATHQKPLTTMLPYWLSTPTSVGKNLPTSAGMPPNTRNTTSQALGRLRVPNVKGAWADTLRTNTAYIDLKMLCAGGISY